MFVTEGVDSSATDSGTEDVLGSQLFTGNSVQRKYHADYTISHDQSGQYSQPRQYGQPREYNQPREYGQPRQYKSKKLDGDGDWLSKRNSGADNLRTGRQYKVIFVSFCQYFVSRFVSY